MLSELPCFVLLESKVGPSLREKISNLIYMPPLVTPCCFANKEGFTVPYESR